MPWSSCVTLAIFILREIGYTPADSLSERLLLLALDMLICTFYRANIIFTLPVKLTRPVTDKPRWLLPFLAGG